MIIADTGFWVALLHSRDSKHHCCRSFLKECQEPLITTSAVLTETTHLLIQRQHPQVANRFLELFTEQLKTGGVALFEVQAEHFDRILALSRQYESLPMDFADASLVLLAEYLGHGRIVSTDQRDFGVYRWKNHHPFQNLLME